MAMDGGTIGAGVEDVSRSVWIPVADRALGNAVVVLVLVDVMELAVLMTVFLLSEVGSCCGGSGCDGSIVAMSYDKHVREEKHKNENNINKSAKQNCE